MPEQAALILALVLAALSGFSAGMRQEGQKSLMVLSMVTLLLATLVMGIGVPSDDRVLAYAGLLGAFLLTLLGGVIVGVARKNKRKR